MSSTPTNCPSQPMTRLSLMPRRSCLLCLLLTWALCGRAVSGTAVAVDTATDLLLALDAEDSHIMVTSHLDFTATESNVEKEGVLCPIHPGTLSILGNCTEGGNESFGDLLAVPLLPLQLTQCVVLTAQHLFSVSIEGQRVWLHNLYLRVHTERLNAPKLSLLVSVASRTNANVQMWLSGMTLQGEGPEGSGGDSSGLSVGPAAAIYASDCTFSNLRATVAPSVAAAGTASFFRCAFNSNIVDSKQSGVFHLHGVEPALRLQLCGFNNNRGIDVWLEEQSGAVFGDNPDVVRMAGGDSMLDLAAVPNNSFLEQTDPWLVETMQEALRVRYTTAEDQSQSSPVYTIIALVSVSVLACVLLAGVTALIVLLVQRHRRTAALIKGLRTQSSQLRLTEKQKGAGYSAFESSELHGSERNSSAQELLRSQVYSWLPQGATRSFSPRSPPAWHVNILADTSSVNSANEREDEPEHSPRQASYTPVYSSNGDTTEGTATHETDALSSVVQALWIPPREAALPVSCTPMDVWAPEWPQGIPEIKQNPAAHDRDACARNAVGFSSQGGPDWVGFNSVINSSFATAPDGFAGSVSIGSRISQGPGGRRWRSMSRRGRPDGTPPSAPDMLGDLVAALTYLQQDRSIIFGKYRIYQHSTPTMGVRTCVTCLEHMYDNNPVVAKFYHGDPLAFENERFLQLKPELSKQMHATLEVLPNEDGLVLGPAGLCLPSCILMKHGLSVRQWMDQLQPGFSDVVEMLVAVAQRLQDLHASGWAHRNVHPENVLLLTSDHKWTLVDFSNTTAKGAQASLPRMLDYTAPEVVEAHRAGKDRVAVSTAVDIWSLGLLAFEALTRLPVFARDEPVQLRHERIVGVRQMPWEQPGICSAQLERLHALQPTVLQCLHRDPGRRPSAPMLVRALDLVGIRLSPGDL